MMANQERLELVLQATDKASAQLQAVRKEIELARGSTDGTARSSILAAQNQKQVGDQARRSAAAMSSIAFAAQSATLGTRGAVMAAGQLAEATAVGSKNMAMWSPHIAAATIVAGTLLTLFQRMNRETAEISKTTEFMLQNVEDDFVDVMFQKATRRKEAAAEALGSLTARDKLMGGADLVSGLEEELRVAMAEQEKWAVRRRDVTLRNNRKERDEAKQEADRRKKEAEERRKDAIEFRDRTLVELSDRRKLLGAEVSGASDFDVAIKRIELQKDAEIRALDKYKLKAEEKLELEKRIKAVHQEQANLLWQQANTAINRARSGMLAESEDPTEAFAGRMDMIAMERDAQIKAGIDVATANEAAERKMRALRLETARSTIGYLKTIESATLGSSNKQVRAIGLLANTIRRLHIGAEASLAAVESARAFGKVPGYLASHQYGSAALSGLAGLKLAAAAALGFRESLGGGGGGGGSGSGGGASGGDGLGTFEPRGGAAGAGGVTVVLITRNPYGRDEIQETIYSLERADMLKRRGVEIPPTTGISRVA